MPNPDNDNQIKGYIVIIFIVINLIFLFGAIFGWIKPDRDYDNSPACRYDQDCELN